MPPCGDHALRSRSGLPRKSPILGTLYGVRRTLGVSSVRSNMHCRYAATPDRFAGIHSSADVYREFP